MTGQQIVEMFRAIVDDQPDSDYEDNLMQHAKDLVESERDWEMLKKVDTSKTWLSSDTYLTTKALPTDFFAPRSLWVTGYDIPFRPVPLENILRFRDISGRWSLDLANNVYRLMGNTSETRTISFVYTYATAAILTATSPVWPARFHKLIPFYMAGIHQGGTDWDAISAHMSPANRGEASLTRAAMVSWDSRLKLNSMNGKVGETPFDIASQPNVVDIDV